MKEWVDYKDVLKQLEKATTERDLYKRLAESLQKELDSKNNE